MYWYQTIERFLASESGVFTVGERQKSWVKSFRDDLKRWGFPVRLVITNPYAERGKVRVILVREKNET